MSEGQQQPVASAAQANNMAIWQQWDRTPPEVIKEVSVGRKFKAIQPYYQMKKATEIFGPVGEGWGWEIEHDEILFADQPAHAMLKIRMRVWCGEHKAGIPLINTAKLFQSQGTKIDADIYKKLITDTITKGLSYYGCAADVFLGYWDDHRYAAEMHEAARQGAQPATLPATASSAPRATNTRPAPQNANPGQQRPQTAPPQATPPVAAGQPAAAPADAERAEAQDLFRQCVATGKQMGVPLEAIKARLVADGHQGVPPLEYMRGLLAHITANLAAFTLLMSSAVSKFGQEEGEERVYMWLGQAQIDLLAATSQQIRAGIPAVTT